MEKRERDPTHSPLPVFPGEIEIVGGEIWALPGLIAIQALKPTLSFNNNDTSIINMQQSLTMRSSLRAGRPLAKVSGEMISLSCVS